jgi:phage shock protein B
MENMVDDLTTVLIVFAGVFGLIALRYLKLKAKTAGRFSAEEASAYEKMAETAQLLERRVATLERILDHETPAWRDNPVNFRQEAGNER